MMPFARSLPPGAARLRWAFTLMEILVVVSIILVLAAIALPVYSSVLSRANKAVALNNMRQVTAALISYAGQNDGEFPDENIAVGTSWTSATTAQAEKVWFNVLPRLGGRKGVGDYARNPMAYYTKDNLLYLPGAKYPLGQLRLAKPYFAFAINTKLQRKTEDPTTGVKTKGKARLSQITNPARTVAFLEEGIPGETQAMPRIQPSFEGEPKTGGRSFVERYGGQGVVTFIDGHAESFATKDLITPNGKFFFPQTNVVWTRTPEEDPN